MAQAQGFRAHSPDGCDPGKAGACVPLVGEVDPLAGTDSQLDMLAGFERQQGGVADEQGGVGLLEHGDGIGRALNEGGMGAEEFAEEDFGVGERTARSSVRGDGANGFKSIGFFNDELDGADTVERSNSAAGDDGEVGGERSDGNEAEVGATAEEFVGAEGGFGVMEDVALSEFRRERWVLEVPHERRGVEKVDGGYADGMG